MELIKEIVFKDPPTKYTQVFKKPKFDKDGKLITHRDYYLTGNLFYDNNLSYHVVSKIIKETKKYLYPYLRGLPEIEKMRTHMIYVSTKDIDLDNKWYFYYKIIMDILKTPTNRQIQNSIRKNNPIITTNTIIDDNTKFVNGFSCDFEKGEHKMIFRIYGRLKSEQQQMDLFFK